MFRVLTVFLLISVVYAKHEIYDGWSIYEFEVENEAQIKYMFMLEAQLGLDILSHPGPSRPGMALVPKNSKEEIAHKLRLAGIEFRPTVDNFKEQLHIEDRLLAAASSRISSESSSKDALPLDRVYKWEEVEEYMDRLARTYPDKVTLVNGGTSYEGRPINYLRISTTNFQDTSKPVVYMQSLLHSREWLTQAVTLYALEKLVVNNTESDLINDIDWIIVPTANPDGYIYSHETVRLWRKNRRDGQGIDIDLNHEFVDWCVGVDLNRNYDIYWGTASNNSVCSNTYHGTGPFSEPETAVTKKILDQHRNRIELFLDIHSEGSYVLYPYGTGQLPPNAANLHLVGVLIGDAINAVKLKENKNYTVGNSATVLWYTSSGGADDYALSVGVPYAYTLELPSFKGSNTRFLVNPDLLEQAGYETWEGIKAGVRFFLNRYTRRVQTEI